MAGTSARPGHRCYRAHQSDQNVIAAQPASWIVVEWWICPSYYSEDVMLERVFGRFEPNFLETLAECLPPALPCFWTGPSVVSKTITLAHVRRIAKKLRRPLLLWDNYPVNDLSMRDELHIAPLSGRDPRLPERVYGYLNNPLLQEELSFVPLATCFDYARAPAKYRAESSWTKSVRRRFGDNARRAISLLMQQSGRAGNNLGGEDMLPLAQP